MPTMKHQESILLFTYKSVHTLLKFGGSQSWVLNEKRARKAKYMVCTRNCHNPLSEEPTGHGAAYFVGKIANLRPAFTNYPEKRWLIEFDQFAEIDIPNVWKGWRNPVVYMATNKLEIDFEKLDFQLAPKRDLDFIKDYLAEEDKIRQASKIDPEITGLETVAQNQEAGISIKEAKKLLSLRYELDEDNIEIILKG